MSICCPIVGLSTWKICAVRMEEDGCPNEGLSASWACRVRIWACPLVGMLCPNEGLSALGALPVHLEGCPPLNAQKRNTEAIMEGMDKLSSGSINAYQHAGNDRRKAEIVIYQEDDE